MINVAILGFGVVGSGIADVLELNRELIKKRVGDEIYVKYILDLREFPDSPYRDRVVHDINIILNDDTVSIVAEAMGGLHPASDFSAEALKKGKSVVTSNKQVVAEVGDELLALAEKNNARYLFEASVGGGIPILRPLANCLAANDIVEINGILNGTTNYILTQMIDFGKDFETALREAQKKGYAEANPTADVEGTDACRKICILAAIAYGKLVNPDKVPTEGISEIRLSDVKNASDAGYAIKLIGRTEQIDGKISISVAPRLVSHENLLSRVDDVYNGILVKGNASDDIVFTGRGAGKMPTASAVCADIIDIARHPEAKNQTWDKASDCDIFDKNNIVSSYYICASVKECDAVKVFGKVNALTEKDGEFAFITEKMTYGELSDKLNSLEKIGNVYASLQILY